MSKYNKREKKSSRDLFYGVQHDTNNAVANWVKTFLTYKLRCVLAKLETFDFDCIYKSLVLVHVNWTDPAESDTPQESPCTWEVRNTCTDCNDVDFEMLDTKKNI